MDYEAIVREFWDFNSKSGEWPEYRDAGIARLRTHFEPKAEPGQDAKERPKGCTCGFSEVESDRCTAHARPADAALRKAARAVLSEWDIVAKSRAYTLDEIRDWLHVFMADKIAALRAALASSPAREDDKEEAK